MSQSRKSQKFEGAAVDKVDDNLGNRLQDAVQNSENEFFNKHYNKELRVSKDEIPIVLAELNESAHAFIKKEQFERALNLLQKAYGIMDAIDFQSCRRDMYHLFIMFHNMALCYQKMQMLEECAQCIEHAFDHLPVSLINLEEKSISYRMRKIFIIGKLKLQYCAILSQIHRHKDALEQAREGVKVCHHMVNDMYQLCQFYVKREKLNNAYVDMNKLQSNNDSQNNSNQHALEDYSSRFDNKRSYGSQSRNRSFSSFLSQQEAYTGFESFSLNNVKNQSFIAGNTGSNKSLAGGRQASLGQNMGNLTRGSANQSMHSLSSFCTVNELEKSISYVERTAKKLLPILVEVKKRMIPDKKQGADGRAVVKKGGKKGDSNLENSDQDDDEDLIVDLSKIKGNQKMRDRRNGPAYDMKNILGYLNQGENLQTLSIGNIMQLQAFRLKDMIEEGKNELELTRESFILKISHLAVSYFCYSTEIRFILQMKEDPTFESSEKQKESEYWHAKSLQIACSFLPGECPLLNHINMSFQKHFAPVKTEIKEDEEADEKLRVVKPLHGIENQKFQPMIKNLDDVDISITPYQMTPLNAVTRPFIHQLKSFNSYTEKSQNNSFANHPNSSQHQTHKAAGSSAALGGKGRHQRAHNEKGSNIEETIMEGMSEDALADSSREAGAGGANASRSQYESDLQLLENLFKKVQVNYNVDKVKLFKKLIDSNAEKNDSKQQETPGRPNKNILQVRNSNKTAGGGGSSTSKHDEISIDQAVDFLMDENILTNESREEDDGGQIIRTPNNIKNLNVKGINQINPGSFNNQTGMKKTKGGSGKALSSSKGGHGGVHTQAHVKGALAQQPLVGPSHSSGQGGAQSMHQRPKTQINGQRNSSNRDSRTQQSTFGPNGSITSIDHASGKSGSALQQSQKSAASQQNMLASNIQRYQQHERSSGNQQQSQKLAHHQVVDAKSKRSAQRPFSGGIQKMIKSDNHKSRVQNFNQKNFSMYEQKMANMGTAANHASGSQHALQTQNAKFLNPGMPAHVQSHSPAKINSSSGSRGLQGVNAQGGPSRFEGQGEHHQLYYNSSQQHQSQQQLSKHPPQSFSQSSSIGASGRNSQPTAAELAANPMNSQNHQKQLQILQKQHQQLAAAMAISGQGGVNASGSAAGGQATAAAGPGGVHMKNQLQGAASNILAGNGSSSSGAGGAPSGSGQNGDQSQAQYEDLKKKLLTEYKKMQKKGGGAVSQNQLQQLKQAQQATHQSSNAQLQSFLNQKNQQQIEQTLQSSAKALSQSHQQLNDANNTQNSASLNANNNLNNSTTSAHLNVYKPTFIINNSYQPGGSGAGSSGGAQASGTAPEGDRNHSRNTEHLNSHTSSFNNGQSTGGQINNPQNLAISAAGPNGGSVRERNSAQSSQHGTSSSQHAQMQKSSHNMHSSFGKKQSGQMRGVLPGGQHLQIQSHPGQQKVQKNTSITPSQQQILLMNVLMSQGMDKAQAQAQVQAQMQQMQGNGSKSHKEGSRSGNLGSMQLQHTQQPSNLKKSNRYQSSSNGRGITPTQESKSPHLITQHHNIQSHQQLQGSSAGQQIAYLGPYTNQSRNAGLDSGHSRTVNQTSSSGQVKSSGQAFAQYHASSQSQLTKSGGLQGNSQGSFHQGVSGTLSAANLPQSSNIVTGGKISGTASGSRGFSQGQQNASMPGRKK